MSSSSLCCCCCRAVLSCSASGCATAATALLDDVSWENPLHFSAQTSARGSIGLQSWFKVGWQNILHRHLNPYNKQNNSGRKIYRKENFQLFLNPPDLSPELLQGFKKKSSKMPPQHCGGVGTAVHFSEKPSFGINNLLFLTPLPHSPPGAPAWVQPWSWGMCREGMAGAGKSPVHGQNLEGIILSTLGSPGPGNPPTIALKNILTQPMSGLTGTFCCHPFSYHTWSWKMLWRDPQVLAITERRLYIYIYI